MAPTNVMERDGTRWVAEVEVPPRTRTQVATLLAPYGLTRNGLIKMERDQLVAPSVTGFADEFGSGDTSPRRYSVADVRTTMLLVCARSLGLPRSALAPVSEHFRRRRLAPLWDGWVLIGRDGMLALVEVGDDLGAELATFDEVGAVIVRLDPAVYAAPPAP